MTSFDKYLSHSSTLNYDKGRIIRDILPALLLKAFMV